MKDGTSIEFIPSPNFNERADGRSPDMLILHYTGMETGEAALSRLCDGEAKVSAHYMVFEGGRIAQMVEEEKRAWHAGVSCWQGERDINSRSIGIEIVNKGHEFGYEEFPEVQMEAVLKLSTQVVHKYGIKPCHVLGHSDVAPERKQDPGELFNWEMLAREGVGMWPNVRGSEDLTNYQEINNSSPTAMIVSLQERFLKFGYDLEITGKMCLQTLSTLQAFQRHYRPQKILDFADQETQMILDDLLLQIEES